ncbi:MAG: hypothetical protein ACKOCB_09540 [Planctomycetia bacterium]
MSHDTLVRSRRASRACASLLGLCALLAACSPMRNRGPEAQGTHIATGDTMTGRLATDAPAQRFSFEGVESSLLDFTLQSDELNRPAPVATLTDPTGKPVDLAPFRTSVAGAATASFTGVVLMHTGAYSLDVSSADLRRDSWYIFKHQLRFPSMAGEQVVLDATNPTPITFTAPYGGTVSVRVRPGARSSVRPDIRGVVDPTGGRALDASQAPSGAVRPQMASIAGGGLQVVFVAPRAGRYTVLAAAQPGTGGEALVDVDVTPANFDRTVYNPGATR